MKITNKLNSIFKIQLFVFLFVSLDLSFAKNKIEPTANSKLRVTKLNDFNKKSKQEKRGDNSKKSSGSNYHDIMSTTSDCSASCCAGTNSAQKVGDSKKKSNNQKVKKKFRWFSRSE